MSLPSSAPLQFDIGSACYQRAAMLFASASMAAVPWLIQLERLSSAALVLAWIGGCLLIALGFWHVGWWGQRRFRRAVWHSDGRWTLTDRAGREVTGFLSRETRVTRHFIRLRWSADPRSLLLAPPDLPAVIWRRLGTRLRLQRDWTQAEQSFGSLETVPP